MRRYYSKAHYERLSNGGPDTKEQAARRVKEQAVAKQVQAERRAKFGAVTEANFDDVDAWVRTRTIELLKEAGIHG